MLVNVEPLNVMDLLPILANDEEVEFICLRGLRPMELDLNRTGELVNITLLILLPADENKL